MTAYVKNTWVDQVGQVRYQETTDDDDLKIFTPNYEEVTELGTPVNAANMNHIEQGIYDLDIGKADTSLSNLTATGEARFTAKANTALDNLTADGELHFVNLARGAMYKSNAGTLSYVDSHEYCKANSNSPSIAAFLQNVTTNKATVVLISETETGATGYVDDSSTATTTGTLTWKDKTWYYWVGTENTLSNGYIKQANLPQITVSGTWVDALPSVLDMYYSTVTYSIPKQSYINGDSWWRVWGDGWIEQGGYSTVINSNGVTINLLKSFLTANYSILIGDGGAYDSLAERIQWRNKTVSSFELFARRSENRNAHWYACGY